MLSEIDRSFLSQQAAILAGREFNEAERDILLFSIENNVDPMSSRRLDFDDGSGLFIIVGFLLRVWSVISNYRANRQREEAQRKLGEELAALKKEFAALQEERKQTVLKQALDWSRRDEGASYASPR
jgi:hypothetical protein